MVRARAGEGYEPFVSVIVPAYKEERVICKTIESLLGVRATAGGQHPGLGTRNALIALGPSTYLEIIGPDPDQPNPGTPRNFGIDTLKAPRLVTWAAKATDLAKIASDAAAHGVALGEVRPGSRRRPDGVLLTWTFTNPLTGGSTYFTDPQTTNQPERFYRARLLP